jgi:hypothetical protein
VTPDPDSTQTSAGQPAADDSPGAAFGASAQASAGSGGPTPQERAAALVDERPEVAVGAAFGGGLLLALILKRLAR